MTYQRFVILAERENRALSNFIETAAFRYTESDQYADDFEMAEIRATQNLNKSLKRGIKEAKTSRTLLVLAFLAATRGGLVLPASGVWHEPKASCRRELKVEGEGGEPLTATTTVFLDDRFAGFTLVDSQGVSRPFTLLNRTGSQCAVHFDATSGEILYLYPGATGRLPEPGGGEIRSGLRHLARQYDGSAVTTVAQFEALWAKGRFQGGRFEAQVYASFNPFGPNTNTLHRYDGFLSITNSGVFQFCVASTDASFLLIDGHEVASWPGKHAVKDGLDGSKRGRVDLRSGIHRFAFLHANGGEDSFAIAAIVPPGEKRHTVIGPERFTPVAYAFVGPLVSTDGQRQADFVWENTYMVTLRDHALYSLSFEAVRIGGLPDSAYRWVFGDGTSAQGPTVNHLFFAPGAVSATLKVRAGDGAESVCRQVVEIRPRYGQNENDDARTLELLRRAVQQERESGIQPEGYALITSGLFFYLKEEEAAAFGERVLAALDRLPEADLAPMLSQLALGAQQVDEQYELAERCFRALLARAKEPAARASAALHFGGMLNLCLNRPPDSREVLAGIRREDLVDWEQRLLDIYRADVALVLDDVATAMKLYAAIPRPSALVTKDGVDRKTLFDYNSRYFRVQNLLSQGLYRESLPEVDLLEWEIPEERASPRMNLLKAQALVGNHQPRKAVVCLQRALLAGVDETVTPRLRLELARLYLGMGQFAPAKQQVALIRKEFPWTLEEIGARELSLEIDKQIRGVTP